MADKIYKGDVIVDGILWTVTVQLFEAPIYNKTVKHNFWGRVLAMRNYLLPRALAIRKSRFLYHALRLTSSLKDTALPFEPRRSTNVS